MGTFVGTLGADSCRSLPLCAPQSATVIGTGGSDEKAAVARAHGCDHVIISTREEIAKRVREITGGEGVPVVYDSVGKDTFLASLDCLRPLGLLVSFGNSSGKVTPFDIGILYAGAFVDIVSQQPVPGSDQPMWNPIQGELDIVAPNAAPGTYAVAMVCFGLNEDPDPAVIAEELTGLLDAADPAQLETAAQRIIPLLIDQDDPLGTGVALFCLDNSAGTQCAPATPPPGTPGPGPAAIAVPGNPAFTG